MKNQRPIEVIKIFNAKAVGKNGSESCESIDLRGLAGNGVFSIYYTFTSGGAATLKLEYLLAHQEDLTYIEPAAASDIATGLAVGSGIVSFQPVIAPLIQIKATEENVAAITALTAYLCIQ